MANLSVRRDVNHKAIKDALLAAGRPVKDCAHFAGLGFDLLTEHLDGSPVLVEVKRDKKATLTESEHDMAAAFKGWVVVTSVDEALAAVGLTPLVG